MATRKPKENDASLPFAALQLLAPPVRLVSAALWKVMKRRDVMQYGILEEFVTSACETVPGLLTARHQGKLALGLRGRLILELCCSQPDEKVIKSHLERIRAPSTPSPSSAPTVRRDVKIQRTVESFHALIQTLLTDPAERKQFFKEEFPVDYGPNFDHELEKLLWEFLIRLDQLLPVPSLVQTVSWLGDAPTVLEECARAATQPQLLKILLQHQTCLGNLETAASLPPNMGDSILASLSLPPSGRVPSNQQTGSKQSAVDQPGGTNTTVKTPFITPVFGLISNEDVPAMISANKRRLGADEPASSKDATNENLAAEEVFKFTVVKPRHNTKDDGVNDGGEQMEEEEERGVSKRSSGLKRKQPDRRESESDEEEEVLSRSRKEQISRSLRNSTSKLTKTREGQTKNGSKENKNERIEECSKAVLETCMTQLGLRLPKDPYLCSVYVSCLSNQPKVVLEKLSLICAGAANRTGREGHTSYMKQQDQRRRSPVKALTCKSMRGQSQKTHPDSPGLDDKENHPVLPSISSSPSRQRTEPSSRQGDGEDYVADSEDEATKNFKGRLFMKRYYKTKHGTYVPTLREYWRPGTTRRNMLSPGSKRR